MAVLQSIVTPVLSPDSSAGSGTGNTDAHPHDTFLDNINSPTTAALFARWRHGEIGPTPDERVFRQALAEWLWQHPAGIADVDTENPAMMAMVQHQREPTPAEVNALQISLDDVNVDGGGPGADVIGNTAAALRARGAALMALADELLANRETIAEWAAEAVEEAGR